LDLVPQEVVILAGIGADIEHAIDLQAGEQLAQMQCEVPLLHVAQRHDVVTERSADPENGVLDDLEHGSLRERCADSDPSAARTPRDQFVIGRSGN
jgi:hypothetical protein